MSALLQKLPQLLIFLASLDFLNTYARTLGTDCPQDCICYQEYLSNLASWKWLENDINIQQDDPLHEDFNPYTEHNEVYDNPVAERRRRREGLLNTVTCILRSNSSQMLQSTLSGVSSSAQILSLIQAPGSGKITLQKSHMKSLKYLVGLEVQGYSTTEDGKAGDALYIAADGFSPLKKLTYLSLEAVELQQRPVTKESDDKFRRKIVRYNYTLGDDADNDMQPPSVIILQPTKAEEENEIVPYNVYRSEPKTAPYPVQPKIAVGFTGLPSLQHLRISGCNLQDITWDMFHKLDSLKFLVLENNDLLFLPDFVFYATSNLTALSLARNRILNLQTVGLVGLLYLQKLDVSYNNITHLSELSLPPFPHLEVADFRYNPIESIFPNTFEVMNSTKTLFLGNPTTPIEFAPNSFYGLTSLIRLDVMNAKIIFLERPMFKGMPELKSLTLTGSITKISYDAFSEVPKLEKLILKECSIQKISMDAFFGLSSLIELDLSHNELVFLPPGLFDQQVSLREVFLQYNKLKSIPPNLFSKIPAKLIRLEGNSWFCSCEMKYWDSRVINQVKRYHVPRPQEGLCNRQYDKGLGCHQNTEPVLEAKYVYEKRVSPTCKSPAKYANKSVFEVLRKDLHYCENPLQQNISIILKATNPTETIELMRLSPSPYPMSKEQEKNILFPPKIKKPWKSIEVQPTIRIQSTSSTAASTLVASKEVRNNIENNLIPAAPLPTSSQNYGLDSTLKQDTKANNSSNISESETPVILQENDQLQTTEPSKIEEIASPTTIKPRPSKGKNNRRKLTEEELVENNRINVMSSNFEPFPPPVNSVPLIYPPISKKALKLLRQQKKQLRLQQSQQG